MASRILLSITDVTDKRYREDQNTFCGLFPKIEPFCEVMLKKYGRDTQAAGDFILWRMRFARWITKATDPHSEYVILIDFPLQQRLHQHA